MRFAAGAEQVSPVERRRVPGEPVRFKHASCRGGALRVAKPLGPHPTKHGIEPFDIKAVGHSTGPPFGLDDVEVGLLLFRSSSLEGGDLRCLG